MCLQKTWTRTRMQCLWCTMWCLRQGIPIEAVRLKELLIFLSPLCFISSLCLSAFAASYLFQSRDVMPFPLFHQMAVAAACWCSSCVFISLSLSLSHSPPAFPANSCFNITLSSCGGRSPSQHDHCCCWADFEKLCSVFVFLLNKKKITVNMFKMWHWFNKDVTKKWTE